jgi:hypothetical protein
VTPDFLPAFFDFLANIPPFLRGGENFDPQI